MATTVQVQQDTLQRLQQERDQTGAQSYDEVINRLLAQSKDSLWGFLGKGHPKKVMRGIRDKHERF